MRLKLFLTGTILAAGFFPLHARQDPPSIVFDSPTKDLGKVPEGEDLKQIFKFTNKGQGQLEILNVQPG